MASDPIRQLEIMRNCFTNRQISILRNFIKSVDSHQMINSLYTVHAILCYISDPEAFTSLVSGLQDGSTMHYFHSDLQTSLETIAEPVGRQISKYLAPLCAYVDIESYTRLFTDYMKFRLMTVMGTI